MSRQKIKIRNDRGNIVASIEIQDGVVVEETLKGCWISDLDREDDGTPIYRLDLNDSTETLENYSNQALLEEVQSRMIS